MGYTSEVIRRASAKLDRRRVEHENEQRRLRTEILAQIPEVAGIERRIRQGMVHLAAAAFNPNGDAVAQTAEIRLENQRLRSMCRGMLERAGYDPDSLDEKPICPRCGDRGWVGTSMCSCLQELCAQEQMDALSSMLDLGDQSFSTFSLEWYSEEVDEDLGMSHRDIMRQTLRVCQNYAQRFGKYVEDNLLLSGNPGLGKTFLSAAIAREVSKQGFSVVYDTAISVFSNFEAAKFSKDEAAAEAVDRYLSCDLLILDDLGSELTTQMTQSALYTIVNTRIISGKRSVISTNLSLEGIRSRYQPMIASRLEGMYRELYFVGKDIRIQQKNRI